MHLDIEGLPSDTTTLQPGNLYVLALEERAFALPLAYGVAFSALAGGAPVWLITEAEPARALSGHGTQAATCREAVRSGAMRVFQGLDPSRGEFGDSESAAASRLRDELSHFRVPAGALVVIDGADRYGLCDLAAWRRWAERFRAALLLLLHRRDGVPNPAGEVQRQIVECAGFGRVHDGESGTTLDIFHWFGEEHAVTGRVFHLRQRDDGRLVASENETSVDLPPAVDEDVVVMLRQALAADVTLPAGWQTVDALDDLWKTVDKGTALTIILGFGHALPLDKLTQAVFRLRQERGARIKIAVREVDSRLRYNQEALLTQLGANLVVPAEVSPARLFSLVSMIQGQVFSRRLPANFEEALATAMPVMEQGYLAPPAFIDAVEAALDNSRALNIESALLRLPLTHGLTPLDALRYCQIKRPGDLCTADEHNVYLFLFACRGNDIALAIDRLFQLPASELFVTENRYLSSAAIVSALEELEPRAAACADLGEAIANLGPQTDAPAVDARRTAAPLHARQQRPESAPAVPRPLPLRNSSAVPVPA